MEKYIVVIDDNFIKHTSKFGPFYGSIITTANESEARLFTREVDAKKLVSVIRYRINTYTRDKKKFPNFKNCMVRTIKII